MRRVRMPAPLSESSWPPSDALSSSLTPATSAAPLLLAKRTAIEATAARRASGASVECLTKTGTFLMAKSIAPQRDCGADASRIRSLRSFERIGELRTDDLHVVVVRAADQAVRGGAAFVLIDAWIAYPDVRIGQIEREAGRESPLHTECQPGAVVVRQSRRAGGIAHGRLVIGHAAAKGPLVAVAIVGPCRQPPR